MPDPGGTWRWIGWMLFVGVVGVLSWWGMGAERAWGCGGATDGAPVGPCGRCLGMLVGMGVGPVLGGLVPGRGAALARTAAVFGVPVVLALAVGAAGARAGETMGRSAPWLMGLMLTVGPSAALVLAARVVLESDVLDI